MPEPNRPENQPNGQDPNGQGPNKPPGGGPGNFMSRNAFGAMLLGVLVVIVFLLVSSAQNQATEITPQEFVNLAEQGAFNKVVIEDAKLLGELKKEHNDQPEKSNRRQAQIHPNTMEMWSTRLNDAGVQFEYELNNSIWLHMLISWTPFLLIAFLIYFFVFRGLRNAGGGPGGMLGNFGRSRHKVTNKEHSSITLDDVAGIQEAKEEVLEIVEFLRNPKKFQRLGGRVPRGVLLIGEPGCGKTLLAKAVAGEADVPFFSISGSDFVEMFVGVGASRVRDLFKQAKDNSPCIIFLDEIDAVGRRRGSGFSSGGHDEREQTLNAILVEMDGFESNDQVIVMAATNRADVLDPALTRPGRFDRQIHVPLPDLQGRMEILKVHSRRIKLGPDVDIAKLARGTPMFSGADLAAIINEAAIGATMLNKDFVEHEDLEEARDKVRWGRARKSHKVEEDERTVIAYHEAGHAILMYLDEDSEPLHKVTIIPRGIGLGVAIALPERDRHIMTRKQLLARLRTTFGGRIAEEVFCGDVSSGAAMDIKQASEIARAMVMQYGMSEKAGFLLYGVDQSKQPWEQPEKQYSDETAELIDREVRELIDHTYQQAKQMILDQSDGLERLAQALLKYETLSAEEVDRIMKGEALNKPTVRDLLKNEQDKLGKGKPADAGKPDLDHGDAPGGLPSPA